LATTAFVAFSTELAVGFAAAAWATSGVAAATARVQRAIEIRSRR
jgi:hypothetical protein